LLALLGSDGPGDLLVQGLQAGQYQIRTVTTGIGVAGGFSLDMSSTVTDLTQYAENLNIFSASGNLFENDLLGSEPVALKISADGVTFFDVPSGGSYSIEGSFGTLEVNADGSYTFTPDDRANPGTQVEEFFYQVDIDGRAETAALTVTVNGTVQGQDSGPTIEILSSFGVADAVPMAEIDQENADQEQQSFEGLREALVLDDGSNEISLPASQDDSDPVPSFMTPEGSLVADGIPPVPSDDPLAHLVPDPLMQEDNLQTMHAV